MQIRSFIIAYVLVLAILLFADRRPGSATQDHYSHVVDLTAAPDKPHAAGSRTRIIAPGAIIPGTWSAGQIPAERLVAPLVVIDAPADRPISLDDIAAWESRHGMIPQGAVIAFRQPESDLNAERKISRLAGRCCVTNPPPANPLPITRQAEQFLNEARYTLGFAVETPVNLTLDRTFAQQLALHSDYLLEQTASLTALPVTGSLIIVAPAKSPKPGEAGVRILAMIR